MWREFLSPIRTARWSAVSPGSCQQRQAGTGVSRSGTAKIWLTCNHGNYRKQYIGNKTCEEIFNAHSCRLVKSNPTVTQTG